MQNPNEDTEWNDALRRHKIIPEKEKADITEESIIQMVDKVVHDKLEKETGKKMEDMTLDELEEVEDEADEMAWREYRAQRLLQMKEEASKGKYGDVLEISAQDYVQEVNKAGEGVYVVLHLYKQGIPLCTIINENMTLLARKFPATKFIKSISTTCIPNYPDKNLPTIFIYFEGEMKDKYIGPVSFTNRPSLEELEWILSKSGAVKTELTEDPRPKAQNSTSIFFGGKSKGKKDSDESSDNDDW